MVETQKIDSLDFEGKTFVFDKTIAQFKVGEKRYYHDEYDQLHGYPYEGYYGEDDPENSVVKAVLEAGGIVRRSISGKTDYYVVGVYDNKNKDYQKQKEKGKPIVAISLEDLKRILGLGSDSSKKNGDEYEFIDIYNPSEDSSTVYNSEDIVIDDVAITGEDCSKWEYTIDGEPAKLFILDYIGNEDEITIPSSINGQRVYLTPKFPGACSFPKCKAKIIRVPGSFTEIPVGFLQFNTNIEEIFLGNGVEVIETNFCFNASKLNRVHFPDSIKEVGGWVLKGSEWYDRQGSEIIAGNVLLHKYADVYRSENDTTYSVPDGVSCIASYAFCDEDDPRYIKRVELPESVRYISEYAFCNLRMSSIKMPSTVINIGEKAFNGTYLRSYYEKKQYFVIGELLYELIPNEPIAMIPDGVKVIADNAISDWSSWVLEELIMPDSVEVIGEASFAGCRNLKSVKLGNNLKRIGNYAFSGCNEITAVSIPGSVDTIGENAFEECVEIVFEK